MRILASLIILAGALSASVIDGSQIPAADPAWGAPVYAYDGSEWLVGFEASHWNTYGSDRDADEAIVRLSFRGDVGTIEWAGATAPDPWYLVAVEPLEQVVVSSRYPGPRTFAVVPDQEVILSMHLWTWRHEYFTGAVDRNYLRQYPTFGTQAVAYRLDGTTTAPAVPEPAALWMAAGGLALVGLRRRR